MNTIVFAYHLDDIAAIAEKVMDHLDSRLVLFNGDMGAGKTTFINALLKVLQSEDEASSPTFSIVNEYQLPNDKVYHFDFYRLDALEEALNFGIEEYLDSHHWLFMEWPDRIKALLPEDAQTITITTLDDNRRSLELTINKRSLTETVAMTEPKI